MRAPDLLIVGGQKCGTTAARLNLATHPHIAFNTHGGHGKEVHFFDRDTNWARGLSWYLAHFQTSAPVLAEKTPNYMQPAAMERIGQTLPHVRLLILLRNPVDRAYSQWNHFNQQPAAASTPWRLMAFENALEVHPALLEFGHYDEQLDTVYSMYPKAQVHVAIAERVRADMPGEYARMLRFAGLQPLPDARYKAAHTRTYAARMDTAIRAQLHDYFKPRMDRIRLLLNDPLPEWNTPEN